MLTCPILGQFGNLLVGIRGYEPSVNCIGQVRPVRSVGQDLLDKIPVTTTQQVFGPKGGPGVDVAVPYVTTRDNWVLRKFQSIHHPLDPYKTSSTRRRLLLKLTCYSTV